jgi:L-rhamnonate dehydratase
VKITAVSVLAKRMSTPHPTLVQIETDEGITGIGATAAPPYVIAPLIEEGIHSMRSYLIGEDPTDPNRLWKTLFETWQARNFGRGGEGGLAVNAMSAIDIALWDIAGKARQVPVFKLLGDAIQSKVMVYASAGAYADKEFSEGTYKHKPADELVRESKQYVEQGFKAIKFGWGNFYQAEDLETLAAIREAIGPDIHLMLDSAWMGYLEEGYTLKDAIKITKTLEQFDIYFLEEALNPFDVNGFKTLTEETDIKIATGESLTTFRDFKTFIDNRACDIIQPDVQQIGISTFVEVARRAEDAGILCIPHCPWSAIAVAGHLQILSTLSNGTMIEYPAYSSFVDEGERLPMLQIMHNKIIEHPLIYDEGYLGLPDNPGLGLGNFIPEGIAELEALCS